LQQEQKSIPQIACRKWGFSFPSVLCPRDLTTSLWRHHKMICLTASFSIDIINTDNRSGIHEQLQFLTKHFIWFWSLDLVLHGYLLNQH